MKRLNKLLAMLLVIAMMASLLCVAGMAEEAEDPYASIKEGTGYVALGDSYTRGYGCSDHWETQNYRMDNYGSRNDNYGSFYCRNVDGSYPNLVAEALGLYSPDDIRDTDAKMWNLAKNAVSTAYTLDLLGIDDNFRDEEFTYQDSSLSGRYKTDLAYFGDPMSYNFEGTAAYGTTGEVMSIREMLNEASLITIHLGQADVLYKAQWLDFNNIDFSNTETLPSEILNLVSDLYEYFNYWKGAYPLLLDYIKENNPDATVMCLGQMNPVENMLVSDEILLPIGEALNFIMDEMNKYTKQYAEERGFVYLDTSNVETPSTESELTLGELLSMPGEQSGLETHPSVAGYAQIARMIVAALDEELAKDAAAEQDEPYIPETPKTFIKVDLGRFQKVDYVTVDGNKVKNYSVENYVLTIPNYTTTANTMSVQIVNEDGTVTLMTYSLQYDNGYTAYRTYQTNDVGGTITRIVKTIVSKVKGLFNSIFDLFK